MIALLDRVILGVSSCLSWLGILLSSPFFPVRFHSRNQLKVYFLCQMGAVLHYFSPKFSVSCSSSSPFGIPMIQMLEHLKVSQRFLSLYSFFWILVSSFCSSWMFIASICSKLFIWARFLPFTVGSLYILLYFTLHSLHFFLYLAIILNHFCEQPDYQCFEPCIW